MDLKYVTALRLISLGVLLYTSFTLSYQSIVAASCFIGSLMILRPTRRRFQFINENRSEMRNPLKGKPPANTQLSAELITQINKAVCDLVTYEAESADSLQDFEVIKSNTDCIFAKKSRLWGSSPWDTELTLEENVYRMLPTFLKFTMVCQPLGLDGFLVKLPEDMSQDVHAFGRSVRRTLRAVSKYDPRGLDCMRDTEVHRRGWVFRFASQTFFITTFAPCYPDTHSRYSFESQNGYILFQPEISFAQHDLPDDTPQTNWDNPDTVRDRIRIAFRDAGRGYHIRDTISFPMVHDIVKPVDDKVTEYIEWWSEEF